MNKKINIIIILLLLTMPLIQAIVTPTDNTITPVTIQAQQSISNEQLQNTITQDGTKTRAEIQAYTDRKIAELINTVKTDGQKFVDENFKVLDDRMQEIATKFLIKITIGTIIAIVMGLSIWYAVYFRINKLLTKRPKTLTHDEYSLQRAGLITPEFAEKIEREAKTKYSVPPSPEYRDPQPKPPSIGQIEAMIALKRKEQEKQGLQKIKQEKVNAFNKKAQKIMPKIQKLSEPVPTNTLFNPEITRQKRQKKITKLQQDLEPARQELNQVLSQEAELDKAIQELQQQSEEFQKTILPPLPPISKHRKIIDSPPLPPRYDEVK